jgi:catechol 2,3-dioxygenase-like lactoylglutathione lyase family enzyme
MDWKLFNLITPVTDVDRAKDFYARQLGFGVDADFSAGETFRVVHLIPPGSECGITLMRNDEAAGSLQGLHLLVTDIEQARAEIVERGVEPSDFFHFDQGQQTPGLHPGRGDYESFFAFSDPDGNGWMVQEKAE